MKMKIPQTKSAHDLVGEPTVLDFILLD